MRLDKDFICQLLVMICYSCLLILLIMSVIMEPMARSHSDDDILSSFYQLVHMVKNWTVKQNLTYAGVLLTSSALLHFFNSCVSIEIFSVSVK